jgi:hypothetical protein
LLLIYRVLPGPDRAISPEIAAAATPENGTLEWKFERKTRPDGPLLRRLRRKDSDQPERPQRMPRLPLARSHPAERGVGLLAAPPVTRPK